MKTQPPVIVLATASVLLLAAGGLRAAGYSSAEITRTHNDVKVLKENAPPKSGAPGAQITPVTSVATGTDSRAELRFPDKSLTRLGANSRFTLRGDSRNLDLDQGVMMLQVPKGVGGAKVRTAAVTAAVTGTTILVEYQPEGEGDNDGYMKVICVEGSLDLFMNDDPSTFQTIKAGQLSLTKLGSGVLGAPVDVDLKLLLQTSKLLNDSEETPNGTQVSQAVQTQQKELSAGTLVQTNLVIPGRGTIVVVDTIGNILNNLGFIVQGPPPPPPADGTPPPPEDRRNTTPETFTGFLPLIAGKTVLSGDSTVRTNPHVNAFNVLQGGFVESEGRLYYALIPFSVFGFGEPTTNTLADFQEKLKDKVFDSEAPWASFKFEDLYINGTPLWEIGTVGGDEEAPGVVNVILASLNGIRLGPDSLFPDELPSTETLGGEGGGIAADYPPYNTLDLSYSDVDTLVLYSQNADIIIRSSTGDNAIYGYNQDVAIVTASAGTDVRIEGNILLESGETLDPSSLAIIAGRDAIVQNATITADDVNVEAGRDVNISGGTVQTNGGKINIKARRSITISNSSQLKSLISSSEAMLRLETTQGDITLTDSTLEVPGGTIELLARQGNIALTNVTSSSDVFKAQTLGTNGWITIGNSTINATSLIQLFAEGANGGVKFVDNATLNSPQVFIKGKTVEIVAGKVVSVPQGHLDINAVNKLYNRSDDLITPPVTGKGSFNVGVSTD